MKVFILFLASLMFSSMALAQSGTVRKVKGKSAIIRFDENPGLSKGSRVTISNESGFNSSMSGTASRNYSLTLSGGFESSTETIDPFSETDSDSMEISATFMINKEIFEFGGGFIYSSTDRLNVEESTYSLVGIGEYNIIPNRPGAMFVPAVQGFVGIANYELISGISSASGNGLTYGFNARLKAFPWSDSFALLVALGLTQSAVDIGGGSEVETSTTGLTFGVQGYF